MNIHIPHPDRSNSEVKIKIDYWDSWSADYTLAQVIHPVLVQLKNTTNSYPSTLEPEEWDTILDKMIASFGRYVTQEYWDSDMWSEEENKEFQEGINLFAKYYRDLWD